MANLDEWIQAIGLLAFHTGLFIRAAHRGVVAQRASARLRGGGQKALRNGAVDGVEDASQPFASCVAELKLLEANGECCGACDVCAAGGPALARDVGTTDVRDPAGRLGRAPPD